MGRDSCLVEKKSVPDFSDERIRHIYKEFDDLIDGVLIELPGFFVGEAFVDDFSN